MAHFYGTMNGGRKDKTCLGHKPQGIKAHIRGWNVGVHVVGLSTPGGDRFRVFATHGSNAKSKMQLLGEIYISETDGTLQFEQA